MFSKEEDEKFMRNLFMCGSIFLSCILLFVLYSYQLKLNYNENYNNNIILINTTNMNNMTNMNNTINMTNTTNTTKKLDEDYLFYYVMLGFFGYASCVCCCVSFVLSCFPEKSEVEEIKEEINNKKMLNTNL